MSHSQAPQGIISIIGGSGFIGRHVTAALAARGWRIRIVCRRPDLAGFLQPLGDAGQIAFVQANVRNPQSLRPALAGSHAVLNLAGILREQGRQTFEAVHVEGAQAVARAARDAGAERLIHVSAIGADAGSPSRYGRSKAEGERRVKQAFAGAIIVRPSLVIGPEDEFFNLFADMARFSWVLPLIGGGKTRFQPVYVGDVARAISKLLESGGQQGKIFELGGPEVLTMRELLEFMLMVIRRKRLLLPIPFFAARIMAWPMQFIPGAPLTPDQVLMLQADNLVSDAAKQEGRTLEGLGIGAEGIEAIVPEYLARFRPQGQFTVVREALASLLNRPA